MTTPKTVRILSLDGGGMKGYFSASFLEKFCQQAGINPNEIWKTFDVIVGTSIGGIQACAYANGMSPAFLKTFFADKGKWIFTIRTAADVAAGSNYASEPSNRPNMVQKIAMLLTGDSFYKAVDPASNYGDSRLKAELNSVFGSMVMTQLKTNVFVPSYDKDSNTPIFWSNALMPGFQGQNEMIKNVALSTGSAPVYLPPANWSGINYIDGGVMMNNPADFGLSIGRMLYPLSRRYCVLSVGCGLGDIGFHVPTTLSPASIDPNDENLRLQSALGDLFSLIEIGIGANQECTAKKLFYDASSTGTNLFYYRFQKVLDKTIDTELDNSTPEFLQYLESAMNAQYQDDSFAIGQFISRLNDA